MRPRCCLRHVADGLSHSHAHSPMLGTRPCRIAARCSSRRRFCSAASIHLTTMGASMPSHTCLLSSASIAAAASSLLPIVTSPQPLVVGAPCGVVSNHRRRRRAHTHTHVSTTATCCQALGSPALLGGCTRTRPISILQGECAATTGNTGQARHCCCHHNAHPLAALPHLEGPEQVDLNNAPKLVEQGPHLILIGGAQHLGEKQLHTNAAGAAAATSRAAGAG